MMVAFIPKGKVKLRVFVTKILKRTFEPKRQEVTVGWREMHNEDLPKLLCSLCSGRSDKGISDDQEV
jgi:hypothetical protein